MGDEKIILIEAREKQRARELAMMKTIKGIRNLENYEWSHFYCYAVSRESRETSFFL